MADSSPIGVLLVQLGTPASPSTTDVRTYLREFLNDPRVLDIPAPARALLLNAVILPFRPRKSAHAYGQIWTEDGSPLTIHTEALALAVRDRLGADYRVAVGMRYKDPSLSAAAEALLSQGCASVVVLPLFPQYSSAATGSAAEAALASLGSEWNVPAVSLLGSFYDHDGFLAAAAAVARPELDEFGPDHLLFSYHGLPEKHLRKSHSGDETCEEVGCHERVTGSNHFCYRAHCYATTRGLVSRLGLSEGAYSSAFQSRLAGQKWIEPYTDKELPKLYESGVRRLAVLTPSFTADCLETLEEIGIRGRNQWMGLGGEAFDLVSCVNSSPAWADAVASMVRAAS